MSETVTPKFQLNINIFYLCFTYLPINEKERVYIHCSATLVTQMQHVKPHFCLRNTDVA